MEPDTDLNTCEKATEARPEIVMPLGGAAGEVFRQLFMNGPTWDGDIVSKTGRDALFELRLATRENGWSFLTGFGVTVALRNDLDRAKEHRDRERANAAYLLSTANAGSA